MAKVLHFCINMSPISIGLFPSPPPAVKPVSRDYSYANGGRFLLIPIEFAPAITALVILI